MKFSARDIHISQPFVQEFSVKETNEVIPEAKHQDRDYFNDALNEDGCPWYGQSFGKFRRRNVWVVPLENLPTTVQNAMLERLSMLLEIPVADLEKIDLKQTMVAAFKAKYEKIRY